MLGRLLAAQAELSTTLAELRRTDGAAESAGLIDDCTSQLSALYALQQSVSAARPADLASLRNAIGASIASAQGAAQQARAFATASVAADVASLAVTGAAARREVEALRGDLFERRIFDPYLKFASADEKDAYEQREAENHAYIERQLAAKTPEGELNAAGATMGQMLDAHSHGAGDSPEFPPRWSRLAETTRKHRDALRAEGRTTAEFDRNLATSVRRYLRDKGLSEAEIDAKLAVAADPLDAVKPYLKTEQDAKTLDESMSLKARNATVPVAATPILLDVAPSSSSAAPAVAIAERAASAPDLTDVMAKFRATGAVAEPSVGNAEPEHGVTSRYADAQVGDARVR